MQSSELTHTLSFGLDIHTGSGDDLQTGCLEARRIRNETNRLDRHGWEWDDIKSTVVDSADHVKNTSQLIVDKALGELETYHDNKDDGWGRPYPYLDEPYPMVMNHGEGTACSLKTTERFDSVSPPQEAHTSKANFAVVPTTSTDCKLRLTTTSGVLEPLKSSTNITSGDFTSQSRTRLTASPERLMPILLSVWM